MERIEKRVALEAIGLLQCAEVNCDNVRELGPIGVQAVKMQIQQALKVLGGDLVTQDVEATVERRDRDRYIHYPDGRFVGGK